MRATLRAPLLLLLAAAALSGCARNNTLTAPIASGTSGLQAQVATEMTQLPGVIDDGVSLDGGTFTATTGAGLSVIQPRAFWREFTADKPTFEFAYSDTDSTGVPTRALVTIRTHLQGTLHIRATVPSGDSTGSTPGMIAAIGGSLASTTDSTVHTFDKPLDETRVRLVALRRAPLPHDVPRDADCPHADSTRVRWRVAAVSGVQVTSKDNTTQVLSVRIQSGALDTTITDPLAFIRLRGLLRLAPRGPVTLTVTTNHTDDVVLFHHNLRRGRLTANGDGTYTGQFGCRDLSRGLWHFGVDAISHATLYDDTAAYDSQRWVFPYVVTPNRMDGPGL